jgi:hypothetical protein
MHAMRGLPRAEGDQLNQVGLRRSRVLIEYVLNLIRP